MIKNKEITKIREITLDSFQSKLITKGWGEDVLKNTNLFSFSYISSDNLVEGYFSFPVSGNNFPVVIWNRGGDSEKGRLDDFLARGILGEIASWGYFVIASQYRNIDEFGGSEVDDIMRLFDIISDFEMCNNSNIAMEGWSRGGMMTYLILTKRNDIKCANIIAGLADVKRNSRINLKLKKKLENMFGLAPEVINSEINKRSAVCFYEKIYAKTAIQFIHGTNDKKISYIDSEDMFRLLSEKNGIKYYNLELIPEDDHYLRNNRKKVSELRKKWFDKYLKLYIP